MPRWLDSPHGVCVCACWVMVEFLMLVLFQQFVFVAYAFCSHFLEGTWSALQGLPRASLFPQLTHIS